MRNFVNFSLLFCFLLVFPLASFSQGAASADNRIGRGTAGSDVSEGESPGLASFEKRLIEIRLKIQKIVEEYREKQLSRETAKAKLALLLKEQQEILNNSEYLAESMLSYGPARRRF